MSLERDRSYESGERTATYGNTTNLKNTEYTDRFLPKSHNLYEAI